MKKNAIWIMLMVFSWAACLDDKNNYDYRRVNEVKRWENIATSYTIYKGEEVEISPTVVLTIDSINPDVSYEWWMNMEKYSEERVFRYKGEEIGEHTLLFCVIDNKTGVKFSRSTTLKVNSNYKNGWLLLSDAGGRSQLSMVLMKSVQGTSGKDSIVYVGEEIDFISGLGAGPSKLVEHWLMDEYGNTDIAEVMVVQDEQTLELNGSTMEKVLNTREEFDANLPAGLVFKDAFLSGGSNYLLGNDGYIYSSINALGNVSHVGLYSTIPLHNKTKYKQIIATTTDGGYFLALEENSNSLVGIVVNGYMTASNGDLNYSNMYDGKQAVIVNDNYYDMSLFKDPGNKWERLYTSWYSGTEFVSVLREKATGKYYVHNFELELDNERTEYPILEIWNSETEELDATMFTDFVDMDICPFRESAVVASGNTLYLTSYRVWDSYAIPFKTFESRIKSVKIKDYDEDYWDYHGGPHLAVVLENGELYILELLLENPTKSPVVYQKSGFGQVRDIIFKWGGLSSLRSGRYIPF